jgi:hypothetical protein
LEGWDTFSGHAYPLAGRYWSEAGAERGARRQLKKLDKSQPHAGGQGGIQDQVFIVAPDGIKRRVT